MVNMCVSTTCLGSLLSSIAMGATASFIGKNQTPNVRTELALISLGSSRFLSVSLGSSRFLSVSLGFSRILSVPLSLLSPGTCIQHDGSHGAFSTSSWLNTCAGWTLDMIGASAFTWEIQHMLGHHPYTNLISTDNETKKRKDHDNNTEGQVQESDPDVFSSFPFMRMHPSHARSWYVNDDTSTTWWYYSLCHSEYRSN